MSEQVVDEADAPLLRAVDAVREVLARPGFAFSDAEVLEMVRQAQVVIAVGDAVKLAMLQQLDTRPGGGAGAPAGRAAFPFLPEAVHESRAQANRDVAPARALMSSDP